MNALGLYIKQLRKQKKLSQADLAGQLGVLKSTISNYEVGLSKPNLEKLIILSNILDIPLKSLTDLSEGVVNALTKPITTFINVPIVTNKAMAGYLRGYSDQEFVESLSTIPVIVDKEYKGKYLCFEASGDSMYDGSHLSICDKDIVLGREVPKHYWSDKLHIKDWFFIIVHKEGISIKQIKSHNVDNGVLTCHSLNHLYDDYELKLDDVLELYNVIKIVDRTVRL